MVQSHCIAEKSRMVWGCICKCRARKEEFRGGHDLQGPARAAELPEITAQRLSCQSNIPLSGSCGEAM